MANNLYFVATFTYRAFSVHRIVSVLGNDIMRDGNMEEIQSVLNTGHHTKAFRSKLTTKRRALPDH